MVPVGPASHLFDTEGNLRDDAARRQMETLGLEVVRVARLFKAGMVAQAEEECAEAARRAEAA